MKVALLACLALLALACAPRLQADVWADPAADFGRYRTFAVSDYKRPADGTRQAENRRLAERVVAEELQRRGFRQVDAERADLLLEVQVGAQRKARTSGSNTWGTLGGIDVVLLDRASGRWLWHGLAAETWEKSSDPAVEFPKAVALLASQSPQRR
jgi:hypothetical protein